MDASAGASAPPPPPPDASPPPTRDVRVLRVSQIDAGRLDGELASLLREQFSKIFLTLRPDVPIAWQPEITLALDALVFYYTVYKSRPTPGMELMNLRYRDERRGAATRPAREGVTSGMEGAPLSATQRLVYGVAFVGARYAWSKLTRHASVHRWADDGPEEEEEEEEEGRARARARARPWSWRRRASRAIDVVENAHAAASAANLLLFLRDGKYRTLLERLVRARLVYDEPNVSRVISFEYLNRQLVWRELSELALFVLPFLSHARARTAAWGGIAARAAATAVSGGGGGGGGEGAATGTASGSAGGGGSRRGDAPGSCVACGASPANTPYAAAPCGHVHCYWCVASRQKADPRSRCVACDARVDGIKRVVS